MKKIVLIGPESTGKTIMSEKLSGYFNEPWVPEFAREYLIALKRPYAKGDLLEIAKGQVKAEEDMASSANKYLFCDTDLLVIKVWSDHIFKNCDQWIENEINTRNYDFYFLCRNDFPWKADPLRENPQLGEYFFNVFKDILIHKKKDFAILEGGVEERMQKATAIVKELG